MEECSAILVKRTRWSETSLIVTWLTDRFGTLRTSARGALRPRSAFAGRLDLFQCAEIAFVSARTGSLHALREVRTAGTATISSYRSLVMASYFAELAAGIAAPMQPSEELFRLLARALDHLSSNEPTLRAFDFFEREAARISGVLDPSARSAPHEALAQLAGRLPASRSLARALFRGAGSVLPAGNSQAACRT